MCKVKCQQTPPESAYTSNNKYITNQESKENSMSRPGFEPGPLAHRASALPDELPRQITPDLTSVVTLLLRSGATGSTLSLSGGHTQT